MKLSAFDVMLLIIAAVIVIKVCMRGFVAEFFSLAAFLAALGLGILFFRPLAFGRAVSNCTADYRIFYHLYCCISCSQADSNADCCRVQKSDFSEP